MGPVASQEAIKELGTNGGGFFNANSAHPFENPTALTNFIEMVADLRDPRGADLHVRPDGARPAARLGAVRRDARLVLRRRDDRVLGRGASATPRRTASSVAAAPRQHGGQGDPLRHPEFGAVRDRDDRRVVRRGQLDARQLHAARRHGAAGQHPARRGDLRRRRRRAVRHARVRRCSPCSSPG